MVWGRVGWAFGWDGDGFGLGWDVGKSGVDVWCMEKGWFGLGGVGVVWVG